MVERHVFLRHNPHPKGRHWRMDLLEGCWLAVGVWDGGRLLVCGMRHRAEGWQVSRVPTQMDGRTAGGQAHAWARANQPAGPSSQHPARLPAQPTHLFRITWVLLQQCQEESKVWVARSHLGLPLQKPHEQLDVAAQLRLPCEQVAAQRNCLPRPAVCLRVARWVC